MKNITTLIALAVLALWTASAPAQKPSFFRIGKPTPKAKKKTQVKKPKKATLKKPVKKAKTAARRRRWKRRPADRIFGLRLGWSRNYIERRFRLHRVAMLQRSRSGTVYAGSIFRSPGLQHVWLLFQKKRLAKVMLVYGAHGPGPKVAGFLAAKYRYLRKRVMRRFGHPTQEEGFLDERTPDFSLALFSGMAVYYAYWHNPKGVRIMLTIDRMGRQPVVTLSYQSLDIFLTPAKVPWMSAMPGGE
jgi:hypothetical protein